MRLRTRKVRKGLALRERAFTLIEVVVAIAVVAILAGAMMPLAGQVLNQQREERTRMLLRQAFEGCFGARDRRVANMRADFGFDPTVSLSSLPILISNSDPTWVDVAPYSNVNGFFCGYNGPYWSGPLDSSNAPLDGWGKTIQLIVSPSPPAQGIYYQVRSAGRDGVFNTTDDLYFPAVLTPYLAFNATVTLQIIRTSTDSAGAPTNITGIATLSYLCGTSSASMTCRCHQARSLLTGSRNTASSGSRAFSSHGPMSE